MRPLNVVSRNATVGRKPVNFLAKYKGWRSGGPHIYKERHSGDTHTTTQVVTVAADKATQNDKVATQTASQDITVAANRTTQGDRVAVHTATQRATLEVHTATQTHTEAVAHTATKNYTVATRTSSQATN